MLSCFQSLKPKLHCVTLGNITDEGYLLVSANTDAKSQSHNSSCVINVASGEYVC